MKHISDTIYIENIMKNPVCKKQIFVNKKLKL